MAPGPPGERRGGGHGLDGLGLRLRLRLWLWREKEASAQRAVGSAGGGGEPGDDQKHVQADAGCAEEVGVGVHGEF